MMNPWPCLPYPGPGREVPGEKQQTNRAGIVMGYRLYVTEFGMIGKRPCDGLCLSCRQ